MDVTTSNGPRAATLPAGAELADQLSELARDLQQQTDVDHTLDAIVHAAVDTVAGAEHASISAIRRRREVETRAATGDLPRAVDHAQYDTGQGPCLDVLYDEHTIQLADLADETRWPDFTRRARELGVGSMLAVQLYVDGDRLGALNLASTRAHAFDAESEHVALLFASHAAVAMSAVEATEQLRRAVTTRQLVGQAQGILVERFRLSPEQAFSLLVRASQHTNRKLVDVAQELVRSGELPQ